MHWANLRYDLTGQRFGRLVATKYIHESQKWDCACDCGKKHLVQSGALRNGMTKSCGCYNDEVRQRSASARFTTHGKRQTKEYSIWAAMKQRCLNKNSPRYKDYGGRGISMCDRWANSFENFLSDMGNRPDGKKSIDRIDNNKGYSPDNCKWSDHYEQANNKRNSTSYTLNGVTKTIPQWAREYGINRSTLQMRLQVYGWSVEDAITIPVGQVRHIENV